MGFYDVFLKNQHSDFVARLMVKLNEQLLNFLISKLSSKKAEIKVLEIGPGKGYFYKACVNHNYKNKIPYIDYFVMDRNKAILDNIQVEKEKKFESQAPDLTPIINKAQKFDIVFVGFVIEHMRDGFEVYNFFKNISNIIQTGGMAVFLCPNSVKLGMEFWNIDYTHIYPTTKRNVVMALRDTGINKVDVIDVNGLCYYRGFNNKVIYIFHRFLVMFYSYRLLNMVFGWFLSSKEYEIDNIFYRAFALLKEENLMIIAYW